MTAEKGAGGPVQARARLQAAVAGSVFNELGVQLSQLGRMLQASKAFRVSLEMHEALVGEHSINLASPLSNLATVLTPSAAIPRGASPAAAPCGAAEQSPSSGPSAPQQGHAPRSG